jgi:hypothetical protein
MKLAHLSMSGLLGSLAVLAASYTCAAQQPFVSTEIPCIPGLFCEGPQVVQNAVFQNIFVYIPATPGETWDQHLANFIGNQPVFGPPTPASLPFVNCMDGTGSPCLQGLTSEAIDNFVQALVSSNYFLSMENNYGVGAPAFAGEQPLNPQCAREAFGSGTGYLNILVFLNCQNPTPPGSPPPPQFNLIFAPDLPPPANIAGGEDCVNGSTADAFHATVVSQVNVENYLNNPGFQSGVLACIGATATAPLNPAGVVQNCLQQGVAAQCAAAALAGAVVCPVFDVFAPLICETIVSTYVGTCIAAAGLGKLAEDASGQINFTAISTNPACFMPSFLSNGSNPRQILGGAIGGATTGGVSSTLDRVAVELSHEMVETITDPAGAGWVRTFPLSDLTDAYDKGEISDICQLDGLMNPNAVSSTAFMPFLFLHVSRYWSNSDAQCMPQFDANNSLGYLWLDANTLGLGQSQPGNSVLAGVAGEASVSGGFWGNALASPQVNLPNVRVTDLGSATGPAWDTTTSPPPQFGNSIDLGGADGMLSYSTVGAPFSTPPWIRMVAPSPDDSLVVELWDSLTGQGCTLCQWPPPSSTCELALQQQTPPAAAACTMQFNAEALTYGLSEPPLDGNVTYQFSPTSAGSVVMSQGNGQVKSCNAITPCALAVTLPNGNGQYTLTATDTVTPPTVMTIIGPRSNFPTAISCSLTFTANFPSTGPSACVPKSGGTNPAGAAFSLTVTVNGQGSVTSTGGALTSGPAICTNSGPGPSVTCSATYSGGTVTLAEMPATSWTLLNVSGTCGTNACNMTQNQNVTVTFIQANTAP